VREGQLRSLLPHGFADRRHTVTDVDDRGLAGGVEIFFAIFGEDITAFTPDSPGVVILKVARKQG
jgi:hypothetical protein